MERYIDTTGREAHILKSQRDAFNYLGLNAQDWQYKIGGAVRGIKSGVFMIFDGSGEEQEFKGIIRHLAAMWNASAIIIFISKSDEGLIPSAIHLNLFNYRVGATEALDILSSRFPNESITLDFVNVIIPEKLPFPLFISWLSHFISILLFCQALNLPDIFNPINASKSSIFRPTASTNSDYFWEEKFVHHKGHVKTMASNISSTCIDDCKPYCQISLESYSELGLTPVNGRDPLGLAEILNICIDMSIVFVDNKKVYPIYNLICMKQAGESEAFNLFLDDLANSINIERFIKIDQEQLLGIEAQKAASNYLNPELTNGLIWFNALNLNERKASVLEALRTIICRDNLLNNDTPYQFLKSVDPSNYKDILNVHQKLDFSHKTFLAILPKLKCIQKEFEVYFGIVFNRLAYSGRGERSSHEHLRMLKQINVYYLAFRWLPEYCRTVSREIEITLIGVENGVAEFSAKTYLEFYLDLCSHYTTLVACFPEIVSDNLFKWIIADEHYFNRVSELKALPIAYSEEALNRYCSLWCESTDLIMYSERFMDELQLYESSVEGDIIRNYPRVMDSRSIIGIRNFIGWLAQIEDKPPKGYTEAARSLDWWRTNTSPQKLLLLFVIDALSYKLFENWLKNGNPDKIKRFQKMVEITQPAFSPAPTITSQGHVTIASGHGPGEHGISDSLLIYRDVPNHYTFINSLKETKLSNFLLSEGELMGSYLGKRIDSFLLNCDLRDINRSIPNKGLSGILGYKMKAWDVITSLPAVYDALGKMPIKLEKPTVIFIQLPNLDQSAHDDGITRAGSPKQIMSDQVVNQYEKFFSTFIDALEKIKCNAAVKNIPTAYLITADHGMDLCTRTTTEHYSLLNQLGLELSEISRVDSDKREYAPNGLYLKREDRQDSFSQNDLVGCINKVRFSGKSNTVYLFKNEDQIYVRKTLCGCGSRVTSSYEKPNNNVCPTCGETYQINIVQSVKEKIDELCSVEYDGFTVCRPSTIQATRRHQAGGKIQPSFYIFAKPGYFLEHKVKALKIQEIFHELSEKYGYDSTISIQEVLELNGERREQLIEGLTSLLEMGYLRGSYIPGNEQIILGCSHFCLRKRPLVGILAHGSISVGESFVPLIVGGWSGNES